MAAYISEALYNVFINSMLTFCNLEECYINRCLIYISYDINHDHVVQVE